MENVKELNKSSCEVQTVESWASWYEGEESWGSNDD